MCGITGFVDQRGHLDDATLRAMSGSLAHRGPDADGHLLQRDGLGSIGLGHRRLSIIDLSTAANQPFSSDDGRHHLVYNGEIYNYTDIRKELESLGHAFRTQGDTEVLLKALIQWGRAALPRCIGMFAFAWYDQERRTLMLCRDRAGVKPLYYYRNGTTFLFASELKAFHVVPGFSKELDLNALGAFFQHAYIPAPLTIFRHARKLRPGHILTFDTRRNELREECYWDINDYCNMPRLDIGDDDAIDETEKLMTSAFQYRMVSDVPVGVFLSGGYDSTLVTSLLQRQSVRPLRTFTIGFEERGFDEAPAARAIAKHLGTDHHEYYCTPRDATAILPHLPEIYDEPFGDSSAIPTILVSQMANRQVKVVLSGEGGDETFCGYPKYLTSARIHRAIRRVPSALRPLLGDLLGGWEKLGALPERYSPASVRLGKIVEILERSTPVEIMRRSAFYFNTRELKRLLRFRFDEGPTLFRDEVRLSSSLTAVEKMLAADYKTYLGEDILTKVDRATMSVSLEGREPFLDHRLSEWTARLPERFKLRDGETKWICRQIVHRHVPRTLMERPKMGFSIPIFKWLASDLSDSLHEYLDPRRIATQGYFDPAETGRLVDGYLNDQHGGAKGRNEKIQRLWLLLMFQMWHERWMES